MAMPVFLVCSLAVLAGAVYAIYLPLSVGNSLLSWRLFFRLILLSAAEYWLVWRSFLE